MPDWTPEFIQDTIRFSHKRGPRRSRVLTAVYMIRKRAAYPRETNWTDCRKFDSLFEMYDGTQVLRDVLKELHDDPAAMAIVHKVFSPQSIIDNMPAEAAQLTLL